MLITLNNGLHATIDDEDATKVAALRWWHVKADQSTDNWYAVSPKPFVWMHRLILGEDAVGYQVDHINGDGLDNRRKNLRLCTRSQNNANRASTPNKYGYRGIFFDSARGLYRGAVTANGRTLRTRRYPTAEEAAAARDRLALASFGEFARLNFIHEAVA